MYFLPSYQEETIEIEKFRLPVQDGFIRFENNCSWKMSVSLSACDKFCGLFIPRTIVAKSNKTSDSIRS